MSTPVHPSTGRSSELDIVGYRTLVAIVAIAYFTIIALTPRASSETVPWGQLVVWSTLYLVLGVWGFAQVQRQRRFVVSVGYLLLEFAVGMRINRLAWGGMVPLILLPLAAQAVSLLPRVWAGLMCVLVIFGVSGNLSWWPDWPEWLRNIASATAAVVFVVVYSGVAGREREARHRAERLAADVAELAAVNERNRIAREIHDTLGHCEGASRGRAGRRHCRPARLHCGVGAGRDLCGGLHHRGDAPVRQRPSGVGAAAHHARSPDQRPPARACEPCGDSPGLRSRVARLPAGVRRWAGCK